MPPVAVYEVASFYTMYDLAPAGKYKLCVCTNLPCALRGATEAVAHLKQHRIVHRDIKADNVMLQSAPGGGDGAERLVLSEVEVTCAELFGCGVSVVVSSETLVAVVNVFTKLSVSLLNSNSVKMALVASISGMHISKFSS